MDCPFTLPPAAQEIYKEVFEAAKSRGDSDTVAAKRAWRVVKGQYRKQGEGWRVKKAPKGRVAVRGRIIKTPTL
jgi:cation transport regulator ChaB